MTGNLRLIYLLLILVVLIPARVSSQNAANRWIIPGNSYLRIPVIKNGIYKISPQDLKGAGIPVTSLNPASLQLFRRGKELSIHIETGATGALSGITFYGQANDGMLDTMLYVSPAVIPHTNYSLYSDTAVYFLGWQNRDVIGKRITQSSSPDTKSVLNFHFSESSLLFNRFYSVGSFYPLQSSFENGSALSTYDTGEGWTGEPIAEGRPANVEFATSNAVRGEMNLARAELVIVGRSAGDHKVDIFVEDTLNRPILLTTTVLSNYESKQIDLKLKREYLQPNGSINISVKIRNASGAVSLSFAKLVYPQKSNVIDPAIQKEYFFDINDQPSRWNPVKDHNRQFYDISDQENIKDLGGPDLLTLSGSHHLIGIKEPLTILTPKVVTFHELPSPKTDYLIISHPLVRTLPEGSDPVISYANYRKSTEGGGYTPFVINIDEVNDYFNYGEPGPQGIRNMISWLYENTSLKFVFLIGESVDPQSVRKSPAARRLDMIPSAGWPGSDLALAMNLKQSGIYTPLVSVGRLNASNGQQVKDYLEKVKKHESEKPAAPWRKNILHLSGGRSEAELRVFREYVDSFEKRIEKSSLGAVVSNFSKKTTEPVEQIPLTEVLNKGVSLITLFGHSSFDITDIDIGYASDGRRQYNNEPYFPAILANGCAVGSIFYSSRSLSNDWILDPHRGAVLFLAHTFNGISASLKHYTDSFYEVLADSHFVSEPFGLIQKEAVRRNMIKYPTLADGITAQQMNLHGDPAIRIFPARLPDYSIRPESVVFSAPDGKSPTVRSDSILISFVLENNGRYREDSVNLTISRKNSENLEASYRYKVPSPRQTLPLHFAVPNTVRKSGVENWKIDIDPDMELPEEDKTNNQFLTDYFLKDHGATPLLPADNYLTNLSSVELVAQVPPDQSEKVFFEWSEFADFKNSEKVSGNAIGTIARQTVSVETKHPKTIFWQVYLESDAKIPSKPRVFTYDPDAKTIESLPEIVVVDHQQTPPQILEGGVFNLNVPIQNVSRTAFQDSISVRIRHFRDYRFLRDSTIKMAIGSAESKVFIMNISTTDEVGEHRINIFFNASLLPEISLTNNEVNFAYTVYADKIPPTLHVNVDGRQLINNDIVSASPVINFQVVDENPYRIRTDTSNIALWLKKDCPNCVETRISLADGQYSSAPRNHFSYRLPTKLNLEPGLYQLRVEAADLSGNRAAPYLIGFRISDKKMLSNAGVFPNPASFQTIFFADLEGLVPSAVWEIRIFSLLGQEVEFVEKEMHVGHNEWIWRPKNLSSGIYIYKMEISGDWQISEKIKKKLSGKIVWMPLP